MKIAFYAPLKSPHHARPSGDRRIAQLFIAALQMAGNEVDLASELRAWEGAGDPHKQADIKARGQRVAAELIAHYARQPAAMRPRCWFTYHLYHKAPDWIGPAVSAALDIPYVLAEASVAPKQRDGPWRAGYKHSVAAVRQARLIFNLNSNDRAGLLGVVRHPQTLVDLKPFVDLPAPPAKQKSHLRRDLVAQRNLDPHRYWLLCVAMMRVHSKLDSYQMLAATTAAMERSDWQLLIVGDGPAEQQVRDLFAHNPPGHVHFLGRQNAAAIHAMMHACDLFVWPAHNEAFGMAILESLGCGLPVVAGRSGGIGDIIEHDQSGILIDDPSGASLAAAIENLLASPATLKQMSQAARAKYHQLHRLETAARIIGSAVAKVIIPKSIIPNTGD